MMSNKTVYLYTLPLCPKCKVLKKKLEQQNIEYTEIVNSEDLTIEGIVDFPVRLNKNFTTAFNKMQETYGEEFAKLNGFSDGQLSYTDFIDNFIDA